jgi:5-methylcytosine-specific restriction endonuclease McrA
MSAEHQRRWRERHPDREREVKRRYHLAHPDRVAATHRRVREGMSPERRHLQGFVSRANERAKRYGLPGRLSVRDLPALIGPCAYCGTSTNSWDHVVPLRAGGANDVSNLVPSCVPCNQRRPQPWARKVPA